VATVGHITRFAARGNLLWLGLPQRTLGGTHRRLGAIASRVTSICDVCSRGARSVLLAANRAAKGGKSLSLTAMGARRPSAPRSQQSHGRPREQAGANHLGGMGRDGKFLATPAVPAAANALGPPPPARASLWGRPARRRVISDNRPRSITKGEKTYPSDVLSERSPRWPTETTVRRARPITSMAVIRRPVDWPPVPRLTIMAGATGSTH
jgi:hypothetical protein